MNNTKPIHLRSDEYNGYIEECKVRINEEKRVYTPEEMYIISRCGVDYALTFDEKICASETPSPEKNYNIIFRIKGPFTLLPEARFTFERGSVMVRPYIIHETASALRLQVIAEEIYIKKQVSSVVPVDKEYIYEALRETAFNISMEEVVQLGKGFQIVQIEFDERGHFKSLELDESDY